MFTKTVGVVEAEEVMKTADVVVPYLMTVGEDVGVLIMRGVVAGEKNAESHPISQMI